MLEMIHRIGKVFFWFLFIIGIVFVILGYIVSTAENDTAVYFFWYLFAGLFLISAFLIRYIFCGGR